MAENKLVIRRLGHAGKVGAQCFAYICGNDVILVDCGIDVGGLNDLKVDEEGYEIVSSELLPDFDWIEKNLERIKGVFITHGHFDHILGLTELPEEVLKNLTIYTTPYTATRIKKQLHLVQREIPLDERILPQFVEFSYPNQYPLDPELNFQLGDFTVTSFGVAHSTPESLGFRIQAGKQTAVHLTDFKFNGTERTQCRILSKVLRGFGKEGVDMLVMDALNARYEGEIPPESQVFDALSQVISSVPAEKRVICSCFASNAHRVEAFGKIAQKTGRSFSVYGRSMEDDFAFARSHGKIDFIPQTMKDEADLIVVTGSQGEEFAVLNLASHQKNGLQVNSNDVIILSSTIIPGNEKQVHSMVRRLAQLGATVYVDERSYDPNEYGVLKVKALENLHASGHGAIEDKARAIELLLPDCIFPIHAPAEDNEAFEKMMQKRFPQINLVRALDAIAVLGDC